MNTRRGFTLIEIAFAMALLVIGLTAVTAVYITALRWAAETRYQYSAIATARQALHAPWMLADARNDGRSLGFDLHSSEASGWLNDYYILRQRLEHLPLGNSSSSYDRIRLQVYAGGDAESGDLVHDCETAIIVGAP